MAITRIVTLGLLLAGAATPALAQSAAADARFRAAQDRFSRELSIFQQEFDRYQSSRGGPNRYAPPPRGGDDRYAPPPPGADGYARGDERDEGDYDPSRYYRPGSDQRVLTSSDRVYAGNDGRYYCKRNDGTTGLIIGAAGGGVLGNVIDGGHSRTVGTLLGAAAGALIGKKVDQNQQVRCQ
jgi:hypothetical protein